MPLVRIITRLREYPTELVRDLRTRGFEVETCVSQDEKLKAADLEITLDQCSAENMSDSISHVLANKDVVILADANADGGKIRSIGMVLMSAEASVQNDRKTTVPVQFNEIYTALLGGRLRTRQSFYSFKPANLERLWQKAVLVSTQRFSGTWKYCQTVGKNLGELSMRTISEAGVWAKSKKLSWKANARTNSSKSEPDLVPSIFNLSSVENDPAETFPQNREIMLIPRDSRQIAGAFHLWKPLAFGSVGVLAVALLIHSFLRSPLKANEVPSDNPKGVSAQPLYPVPALQVIQKTGSDDAIVAPKILAKSRTVDDDDYFQEEVVVRHFTKPSPGRALTKNGIKRRVVVN